MSVSGSRPVWVSASLCLCLWAGTGWATERAHADTAWSQEEKGFSSAFKRAPRTATTQTIDAVRWMAKRKQFSLNGVPYGFTGLPIFYYSPNTGWNYGARIQWADYRRQPYRYKLTLHMLHSTQGRSDAYLRLKIPHISDTGFGVILLLRDKRDIRARYYGLGNDSQYDERFTDPGSPYFKDENYYFYVLREPRFIFSLLRHLWGPFNTSIVLGLERTDVSPRGRRAFYLDEGTPDGVKDGVTGFVGATLYWDTRDDDAIPRKGTFHFAALFPRYASITLSFFATSSGFPCAIFSP